jgi:hypothetical protein
MIIVIAIALFIVGIVLAAVDEMTANGRSLTAWGVIAIGIGLLILEIGRVT